MRIIILKIVTQIKIWIIIWIKFQHQKIININNNIYQNEDINYNINNIPKSINDNLNNNIPTRLMNNINNNIPRINNNINNNFPQINNKEKLNSLKAIKSLY